MKKFNKIMSLLLVLAMVLGLAACGAKTEAPKETAPAAPAVTETAEATPAEPVEWVNPFADIEDYDEKSQAVYDLVLGDFYDWYQEALAETNVPTRMAKMAIAEAKMLEAGIFLPTTCKGGNFAMTRIAPRSNSTTLWGNDAYRFHDRIICTEPIKASDVEAIKAQWATMLGTGEFENWVKNYLAEQGYETTDKHNFYFDADPQTWDALATSMAADSEILVQGFDGLVEYDMENQMQPALAESWEVSEDGLTYTFHIRQGVKWVDNQGRPVADVKADDFVAGMQHMMDAMGGLEYLVQPVLAGADDYITGNTTNFEDVGVKAVDDYTLQYTLTAPASYFMTMLSYNCFAPMSREYYESMGGKFGAEFDAADPAYKYGKGPDSIAYCGPFLTTNFTSNNTIAMVENPEYWNVGNNNITTLTYLYTDGSDALKPYTDFFSGVVDSMGMTAERMEVAKKEGTFDEYAYVSDTDATTYMGFLNVNRSAYANYNDASTVISPKTDEQKERAYGAMLNQHFRLALVMSIDRGTYNAQSVGEDLKMNSLINSLTPGTYVNMAEDVTVDINGTATTFPMGTMYGEIVQAQLDADGVAMTAWNGSASTGFDGWYNPENAAAELDKACEELAALGIEISAENPIYIDMAMNTTNDVNKNMKNVVKQSVEAATGGRVIVNLTECETRDIYLAATYRFNTGAEANYDINDGSGWGPDYGDPQTYLDIMLPQYAGYMTKSLGIF